MKQLEPFVLLQSQWHVWTWRAPCEHWRHANCRMYWNAWHNWSYPVITLLIFTPVWGTGSKRYAMCCNQNTLNVTIKNTAQWQLLHKILSLAWTLGLMLCCIVFVLLKTTFMFVCLKRLASFLTFGLWDANVAHFLFSSFVVIVWALCCICVFSLAVCVFGKLLFCAMVYIISHSVCLLSSVSGGDIILLIWER